MANDETPGTATNLGMLGVAGSPDGTSINFVNHDRVATNVPGKNDQRDYYTFSPEVLSSFYLDLDFLKPGGSHNIFFTIAAVQFQSGVKSSDNVKVFVTTSGFNGNPNADYFGVLKQVIRPLKQEYGANNVFIGNALTDQAVVAIDTPNMTGDSVDFFVQGYSILFDNAGNLKNNYLGTAKYTLNIDSKSGSFRADKIKGSSNGDTIHGLAGNDLLDGRGGDDYVDGGGGRDTVIGGKGSDILNGGRGKDKLIGGAGEDMLDGQGGRDNLIGGGGSDHLFGGAGRDRLDGGRGDDFLFGEEGPDIMIGGTGNDRLFASSGNDRLIGGADDDILFGDSGNDRLVGGNGGDQLSGGDGNDLMIGGKGSDEFLGGTGEDTLVFAKRQGDNAVIDFEQGSDLLDLRGMGFRNKKQVLDKLADIGRLSIGNIFGEFDYSGSGALLVHKGTSIFVLGVLSADMARSDFIV